MTEIVGQSDPQTIGAHAAMWSQAYPHIQHRASLCYPTATFSETHKRREKLKKWSLLELVPIVGNDALYAIMGRIQEDLFFPFGGGLVASELAEQPIWICSLIIACENDRVRSLTNVCPPPGAQWIFHSGIKANPLAIPRRIGPEEARWFIHPELSNESRRTHMAVSSLTSLTCPICNGSKKPRQSFCRSCFKDLPHDVQHALYRRFPEYVGVWIKALEILLG